ncbi:MAG: hypothetical protein AB7F64_08690 [Gammaproteobacteria bacterium]
MMKGVVIKWTALESSIGRAYNHQLDGTWIINWPDRQSATGWF